MLLRVHKFRYFLRINVQTYESSFHIISVISRIHIFAKIVEYVSRCKKNFLRFLYRNYIFCMKQGNTMRLLSFSCML